MSSRCTRPAPTCWPGPSASTSTGACSPRPTAPPSRRPARCWPPPAGCSCSRASTTTRTSVRSSATPPASGWTPCCSGRAAPTRSTAGPYGSRWGTCCGCRSCGVPTWAELRSALAGFTVLALAPHPPSVPLSTVDPAAPRLALLLGAEGPGLTAEALAAADQRVRIPMAAGVDSLNVATAAAIAIHQLRPPRPRPVSRARPGAARRTGPSPPISSAGDAVLDDPAVPRAPAPGRRSPPWTAGAR